MNATVDTLATISIYQRQPLIDGERLRGSSAFARDVITNAAIVALARSLEVLAGLCLSSLRVFFAVLSCLFSRVAGSKRSPLAPVFGNVFFVTSLPIALITQYLLTVSIAPDLHVFSRAIGTLTAPAVACARLFLELI
jgi:hypothetical protein